MPFHCIRPAWCLSSGAGKVTVVLGKEVLRMEYGGINTLAGAPGVPSGRWGLKTPQRGACLSTIQGQETLEWPAPQAPDLSWSLLPASS